MQDLCHQRLRQILEVTVQGKNIFFKTEVIEARWETWADCFGGLKYNQKVALLHGGFSIVKDPSRQPEYRACYLGCLTGVQSHGMEAAMVLTWMILKYPAMD